MTAPNLCYSLEYWQLPNDREMPSAVHHVQEYDKAENFVTRTGFPHVVQDEPGQWALENYDWSGEMVLKSSSDLSQNFQFSDLYPTNNGDQNWDMTSSWVPAYQTPGLSHDDLERQHIMTRVAAERALFMTPSVQALSVSTLPGSPISDHSSTPEITQTSFNRREDRGASPLSDTMSENSSAMHPAGWANCPTWKEDEVLPTMLEMPDGSSRKTSNWLPVDPEAGFTIGSSAYTDWSDLQEGHDIHSAFMSSTSPQWTYTG
ncbi:hypothetical protein N7520_008398 [Penicillium odoratum]|uniref:uncharacterized protein n=1 Tax=Penicillium odoratum TaxID=1167516 RepID=UPI002548611F|nr:uncharacterized protein N7520_008398 [Penicillium odoratum]KAJ5761242.1 hypothetical protein N7520_008398 [Penicillium odoratum]